MPVAAQSGVDLLRTFYLFDKLPVPPTSALPGPTWRTFVSASGRLEYSVPPSWSATAPPTWEIENGQVLLTDAMSLVGPKRSAGWITYAGQSLVMGTADDAAGYGLRDVAALLGARARPMLLSVERTILLGASITFEVARWGSTLAVVRGGSHVSGIDFVFYDAMAAAEERFTASTRSVFLPLIYEHIGGGGTPVAWGGAAS